MSDTRREIAERLLKDDLKEATDGRDSLYDCEQCAEIVLGRGMIAMSEYAAAVLEEEADELWHAGATDVFLAVHRLRARAAQERQR